jgi:hypothetical protein
LMVARHSLCQDSLIARHSLSRLDCLAFLVKTPTQISRTITDYGTLSVISALQPHLGSLFTAAPTSPGQTHLHRFHYRCWHCSSWALIIPSSPQASRLTHTKCQIPDDMNVPPWSSWTPCRLDLIAWPSCQDFYGRTPTDGLTRSYFIVRRLWMLLLLLTDFGCCHLTDFGCCLFQQTSWS